MYGRKTSLKFLEIARNSSTDTRRHCRSVIYRESAIMLKLGYLWCDVVDMDTYTYNPSPLFVGDGIIHKYLGFDSHIKVRGFNRWNYPDLPLIGKSL